MTDNPHGLRTFSDRGILSTRVPVYIGDLNDIATNSVYNVEGIHVTNLPANFPEGAWGFIVTYVHVYSPGNRTQILYGMNVLYKQWMRHLTGGTWHEWRGITYTEI